MVEKKLFLNEMKVTKPLETSLGYKIGPNIPFLDYMFTLQEIMTLSVFFNIYLRGSTLVNNLS